MEIRLGGMPGVSGFCKEAQISYSEGLNQPLFFQNSGVVCICGKDRMNKEKEGKDDPIDGNEKQV